MTDLEIPQPWERHGHYRFFEMLPLMLSIGALVLLLVLSMINASLAAFFVLLYVFVYLSRALAITIRSLHGYNVMRRNQRLNWLELTHELESGTVGEVHMSRPAWHHKQLALRSNGNLQVRPSELIHAVIIPTLNESREILEPTIRAVMDSNFPMNQVYLIIAYEARSGKDVADQAKALVAEYRKHFAYAEAISHTVQPDEIPGKGGNLNNAGRFLLKVIQDQQIDPLRVVVTTLDADNRPDKQYFACLSYAYCVCPDPVRSAFQPIAIYNNNIWDAPAPMRVIATSNSIYNMVLSMRPHAMRNFSAHAQGLASLIETNFWSARTIVEDGHQFWRSYFRFDGNYIVYPLHVPIGLDAVLSATFKKTLRAQFIQLRRWAYGASDIAYVVDKGYFHKNKVPRADLFGKTFRLIEGHITWAVGPILTLVGGFVPVLFHTNSLVANQLPNIVGRIQTFAMLLGLGIIYLSLKTLPPKPKRYKLHRTLSMALQWLYLPFVTVAYHCTAAFYSQTRLFLGKYFGSFEVTDKTAIAVTGEKVSSHGA